jgi:hypothetical protein
MVPKLLPEEVTGALLSVAPNIKHVTGPAECILLTRIAVDVCRACGVLAKPLAVTVALRSDSDPDATVRLGFPGDIEAEDIWDGHLVCVIDHRLFLDLTIDSMTIPELGLHPQPFSASVDAAFIKGGQLVVPIRGGQAVYTAMPERQDFRGEPKWDPWPPEKIDTLAAKVAERAHSLRGGEGN